MIDFVNIIYLLVMGAIFCGVAWFTFIGWLRGNSLIDRYLSKYTWLPKFLHLVAVSVWAIGTAFIIGATYILLYKLM